MRLTKDEHVTKYTLCHMMELKVSKDALEIAKRFAHAQAEGVVYLKDAAYKVKDYVSEDNWSKAGVALVDTLLTLEAAGIRIYGLST